MKSLRADYAPLTENGLQKELDEISETVQNDVMEVLKKGKFVWVAFDSWTDQHGRPVIGWMVKCPKVAPLVYKYVL